MLLLAGYSVICGLVSFVIQLFMIMISFYRGNKEINLEKENKRIVHLLVKLLLALLVSICITIISFFVIGIMTMIGLQTGR